MNCRHIETDLSFQTEILNLTVAAPQSATGNCMHVLSFRFFPYIIYHDHGEVHAVYTVLIHAVYTWNMRKVIERPLK